MYEINVVTCYQISNYYRWESMQQLKEIKDTSLSQAQGYVI
jgi:hypothetical protein